MMDDTNDEILPPETIDKDPTSPDSSIEHDVLSNSDEMMDHYSKWWLHDFGCQDTVDYYRNTINHYTQKRFGKCYNDLEVTAYQEIKQASRMLGLVVMLTGTIERHEHKRAAIEYYKRANRRICSLWTLLSATPDGDQLMCDSDLFDDSAAAATSKPISLVYYYAYMSGMLYVTIVGLLIQCFDYRKSAKMIFELAKQAPDNECRSLYEYGICLLMKYVNGDKERSRKRMRSFTCENSSVSS